MGNPSLAVRFAFAVSLSLAASFNLSQSFSFLNNPQCLSSSSASSSRIGASASDLLALLGSPQQASAVNARVAQELRSCLKFLVPFTSTHLGPESASRRPQRRMLNTKTIGGRSRREENELIWWPPVPVMELARLAVDSGGDPGAIHLALDPTVIPVPDIEGSRGCRCELTRTAYGRHFINAELNLYLEFLFELIIARGPSIGLNSSLNRYDFFHGHLFLATNTGRLGILFHAKEYPAYDKELFPYNMGFCQVGSTVAYDDSMNFRNILWLAPLPSNTSKAWLAPGVLVVLDAHPGGIIYKDLIPEYVKSARTIYEDDFGECAVDVNYLNAGEAVPNYQIFIC